MSAYSAIFMSGMALVVLSPVLAVIFLMMLCVRQWRQFGVRFLLYSLSGGAVVCAMVYAAVSMFAPQADIMPMARVALFGAGFSIGAGVLGVWLLVRRVLSNPSVNADARASSDPHEPPRPRAGY